MSSSLNQRGVRPVRWPWIALVVFLSIAIVGLFLVVSNNESVAAQVPYVIAFTMFGLVGALIVSRDRRNVIGLMLVFGALIAASSFLGGELTTWLVVRGHRGPAVVLIAFLNNFGWLFGILPVVFLLPLLFPDGHLPSRRWRPFLWFILAFLSLVAVLFVIGQRRLTGSNAHVGITNPLYLGGIANLRNLDPAIGFLSLGIFATSVFSLLKRFRRAAGIERQQIKWVALGLLAAFFAIVASNFLPDAAVLSAFIAGTGFLAFPVSIGIAVLRFHLYDLDVVIRKAVVYATLAVFATLVYLGLVVGLGTALGRGSSFLTMVAAVVVALTFQPVRTRLTRFANRLVYGDRATPYEVLSEFSSRVGGSYADQDVLPRMARVLGEGIGAERADVWLRVEQEFRDVATWPPDASALAPMALANGSIPPMDGADAVYPVKQAGELLGALAVRKPTNDPVSSADEKLIIDLAGQAGLALRNVRLTEELKARLDDLKAAQKRIVNARDEERRRLERNIHDGAQQQLVALAVKLRLADGVLDRDPSKAHDLLTQLQAETHGALEDLRDLARGIYPPLLADKGLAAALEGQARKSTVKVEVRAEGVGRYPQELEAAVYFSCLEALQNIEKYADASLVTIELAESDGALDFRVRDDGCGFDPASTRFGSGLRGIEDRLAAIEGTLEIRSAPGSGTTVEGRLPIGVGARVPAS